MGSFLGSFGSLVVTIVVAGFILYKALYYVFYVRARIRISKGLPPLPEPRPPRAPRIPQHPTGHDNYSGTPPPKHFGPFKNY
jgi:hypothetical protein